MARSTAAIRALPTPAVRPGGLEIAAPVKRRPTWTLAGVGLVLLAMLLGAWVFVSQSSTVSVLVTANDIEAGELVTAADLRVVELSRTGSLRAVQPSQQDLIVGLAARGPIPAGTVLNTGLVVDAGTVVPSGKVVVGVALDPGASPSGQLAAGDVVEVLAVARAVPGATTETAMASVVATGSVWSVESIGTGTSSAGRTWVSLLIPQEAHTQVAQAASEGRLRLGLLGSQP